jgi:hypothetical protein
MAEQKQELVAISFNPLALQIDTSSYTDLEGIGENYQFKSVIMPSGGGLTFTVPTEDPNNPDTPRTLTGVILCKISIRKMRENPKDPKSPVICYAADAKIGQAVPGNSRGIAGGNCAKCPFNKECGNRVKLYLLQEDKLMPILVSIPYMSIKRLSNFVVDVLMPKNLTLNTSIVEIGLVKCTNSAGIDYSEVTFKLVGPVPDEHRAGIIERAKLIEAMAKKQPFDDEPEAPTTNTEDRI